MPVIETETGEVIRDGAAIIDHYEEKTVSVFSVDRNREPGLLFDVIGAEGLLRPAMHYRWNFPEENLEFLISFSVLHPSANEPEGNGRKADG